MPGSGRIFERTEKKYRITANQRDNLLRLIADQIEGDAYGRTTVCSIYFDTPDYRVIRASVEKPLYKEKLRLRSYGIPAADAPVYLELKKKYKGVVYKRGEKLTLSQAQAYLETGVLPKDTQIMREIDWALHAHGVLAPAILISCQREAFYSRTDKDLRITFDDTLQFRTTDLNLASGAHGQPILPDDSVIMEIKTPNAMPLWLTGALDMLCIYPGPFSKYGTAYQNYIAPSSEEKHNGYHFSANHHGYIHN